MRIAKSTIVLLTFVLMLSILVANVADFINVESYPSYETFRDNNGMAQSSDSKYPKYYNIGRSYDRLMWFLQVCLCFEQMIMQCEFYFLVVNTEIHVF